MTNTFIETLKNETFTENGAIAKISTTNALVDFFFHAPALRVTNTFEKVLDLFKASFYFNKELTLRCLFYIRDCRGGQGERRIFRMCLEWLAENEADWVINNLKLIPEYGRWDDILPLLKVKKVKAQAIKFLNAQYKLDLENVASGAIEKLSLLGKWLPSENASCSATVNNAKILIKSGVFGTAKEYRKNLSTLRSALQIVEKKLCNKEYENIDYAKLPSYAALKYRAAFQRNDGDRYASYLAAVKSGKANINAGTLYPYDLIKPYTDTISWKSELDPTVEAQWQALPDYVPEINGLPICDTSGSMNGLPLQVAMSLSIYIAERNKSEVWKNYVIPFSSHAQLLEMKGETLLEKAHSIYTGDCSNTNLQAVFDLILNRAIQNNVSAEDMPKTLIIISDMEFDSGYFGLTNYETIVKRYVDANYELPKIVWWNVASRNINTPVTTDDKGNILLSGCSPSCLKIALDSKFNLYDTVLDIINQDRYSCINYRV